LVAKRLGHLCINVILMWRIHFLVKEQS